MSRRYVHLLAVPAALAGLGLTFLTPAAAAPASPAAAPSPAAPSPATPSPAAAGSVPADGALSHFDLSRKDCLGTSRTTASKVWYTVADGVLSDTYAPYIDQTNIETMQYVVTDGRTFTDLQSRDTTYTVAADASGMECTVTSTAKSGRYRLVTTYLTDPARNSLVVQTRFEPRAGAGPLQLYVRIDPSIGGNGGGGDPATENGGADDAGVEPVTTALVSGDARTRTNAVNRTYAAPLAAALRADRRFLAGQSGYVGTASDGLVQLEAGHRITASTAVVRAGNVAQTAWIDTGSGTAGTSAPATVRLALGFAGSTRAAIDTAGASVAQPFATVERAYRAGWDAYDARLTLPTAAALRRNGTAASLAAQVVPRARLSANVLKASEDKTFTGATVASLASPWGQAVSAGARPGGAPGVYFGSYREVFARDLYETFTGFLADGDLVTARDSTRFLFQHQQLPDGRMPRNSLLNGLAAPDTGGDQLDETAFPILMAWQSGLAGDAALYRDHIRKAADFLVARGPSFGNERWEEQSGYSPSTIAAEIAGLVAAGRIAEVNHDTASARTYLATADDFARSVKGWTVTTTGPYADRYFIRLSKTGDPNAAIEYNLGNGGPTVDQRAVMDAGFLELPRLGILAPEDPDVVASLPVVDRVIGDVTPAGQGYYRYGTSAPGSEDGYGSDSTTGQPWPTTNTGTGHLWPVLSGERGQYEAQTGNLADADALLASMGRGSSGVGLVPEQDWEAPALPASPAGTPPETASIGFQPGRPAGSAAPLTWAQAQGLRLAVTLASATPTIPVERPAAVAERYVAGTPRALPLTLTTPVTGTQLDAATTTVAGTTARAATVDISVTDLDTGAATTRTTLTAGPDGSFRASVPVSFGTSVVSVNATTGAGTAHTAATVVSDRVTGTTVLDVTDPTGDDNGPGTYVYPLAADFRPGAFDIQRFQVVDAGDVVYLRTQLRDLSPTFGDALGAQLLTVYSHNPAAGVTSTAATYPDRNYTVADGWDRAVEVRGFAAPAVTDSRGAPVAGAVTVQASAVSRYVTVIVPKSVLGGTPGTGWTFTVALWGQDGYGSNGARVLTPTPTDYTFGVCATGGTPPICSTDPARDPLVMDTVTPAGVPQSGELDPTRGPVALRGVTAG